MSTLASVALPALTYMYTMSTSMSTLASVELPALTYIYNVYKYVYTILSSTPSSNVYIQCLQ